MLNKGKNVNKFRGIIVALMVIVMTLGVYIKTEATTAVEPEQGTIKPIYKPEWEKVSSSINIDESNLEDSTISVVLRGTASHSETINSNVSIDYSSTVTGNLTTNDITVYINNQRADWITKSLTIPADTTDVNSVTYTLTLSKFEETERQLNVPYKEWSGNIKIRIGGRGEAPATYDADVLLDKYGNQSMMATDETGTWIDVTYQDTNTDHNSNGTMFVDFVRPEFTYEYSNTTIVGGNVESVTVVFDVTDQYFASSQLTSDLITVKVADEVVNSTVGVTKTLTKIKDVFYDKTAGTNYVNTGATGTGTKVGERYQLVITGLDKGDAFKYSGYMTLDFPAGVKDASTGALTSGIIDKSGNLNPGTTITIGLDDTDGNPGADTPGTGTIVDIVDPIWKVTNIEINENLANLRNSTVTLELTATDKYYLSNVFEEARAAGTLDQALRNNILLSIDGQLDGDTNGNGVLDAGETPTITKTLSTATNLTPAGTGVKYTLTFSNWDAEKYSGTARFKIPAGTITDQVVDGRNNESNEQEFIIGHIDFTKPVITKVSSENIDTNSDGEYDAQKIIFKATDKFMVMSDLITIPTAAAPSAADEITVYVDNEVATGITRTLTSEEITEVVNGVTVKGHQYTLIISNFEQTRTTINRTREFSDWSGTVRIDIKQGAVRDEQVTLDNGEIAGGNVNDLTPITGEFADFIKPNVTYEYSSTDIVRNHANKAERTFTMVFDVTDKYFTSSAFATAFAAATTDAQRLAVLQEYLTIWVDDVDITNVDTVTKKIVEITNVTATMNKTTDIANKTITNNAANQVIGKRFKLEISNLEQDADTAIGNDFLNYSGVITVGFNASKPLATDASSNSNVAGSITTPSITSGVTTPDGSGSEVIVDLVDPLWEQGGTAEARPYEHYAKIPLKGTDKYIQTNNLQPSDITITVTRPSGTTVVNGAEASTKGMELTVTQDTSVTLAYGKQYNVVLTGYASDAYQVKLTLRDGILSDTSGNTSQETSFILFTSLVETSTETEPTSEFLAQNKEAGQVIPQRQYVEQVIFQNDLNGINSTKWDVSQLNDGTIWAWYTTREVSGTTLYTVYIGSYIIMNGNVNSSYLFANLGYNENCKVTGDTTDNEFIENLYVLQTASIENMNAMFYRCGYAKMQSLDLGTAFNTVSATGMNSMFMECGYTSMVTFDLGDKFDTTGVTKMDAMFAGCGYMAMTSLDLSSGTNASNTTQFNTSNVNSMVNMFWHCGNTAMITLNLGNNFNTRSVTSMHQMFYGCGFTEMTSLNLGNSFDTKSVTDMRGMFAGCGYTEMTNLNLGEQFDTSNVEDMTLMFNSCGYTKMTSLDLGDYFYTSQVNKMFRMFYKCGNMAMTTLDLGPAFTRISNGNVEVIGYGTVNANGEMFLDCGTSTTTIYAPEAIYSNMKNFKINAGAASGTISAGNGTINPIYKPEWSKVSSSISEANKTMTVVVKGSANKTFTNGTYTGTYVSDVTSALAANKVTVHVNGEQAEGIDASDITVTGPSTSTNATTGKTEVQYTITISNFEQLTRFTGKNFKEWSGNVELQLAKGTLIDTWGSYTTTETQTGEDGNPVEVQVPVLNVAKDASGNIVGNQNLAVIDIDIAGTMENIVVEETTKLEANTETTEANMFADFTKPEYTYEYSTTNPDINTGVESVTVVFDVTDKYFESTALASDTNGSLITVEVDGDENANTPITKVLTKIKDVYYDQTAGINYTNPGVAGTGRKVGERYQLVITGLDREDGFTYSGPMTLTFAAGAEDASGNLTAGIRDKSGNLSPLTAITMGVNEPGGDSDDEIVVDVVDPIWEIRNAAGQVGQYDKTVDANGNVSASMTLIGKDKYFKQSTLTKNDIKIKVDGIEDISVDANGDGQADNAPDLVKTLSTAVYIKLDGSGNYVETTSTDPDVIGVKYQFSMSGLKETDDTFFANRADYNTNPATGRPYREYSGEMSIVIPAEKLEDQTGNKNNLFTVDLNHVDTLKPEVIKVSSQANINATNRELSTHTIVFDIVDKYINSSAITATDTSKIHVYLDGEEAASITKPATETEQNANVDKIFKEITNIQTLREDIDGDGTAETDEIVGYRYTLVLSGIEKPRTSINYDREYTDWSGDLSIKIDANTAKDTTGTGNDETILYGNEDETTDKTKADHVDYVKPDATYEFSSVQDGVSDVVDKNGKTYEMTFDITDKFFQTDNLSPADFSILMSAEEETGTGEDGYYDIMANTQIDKALESVNITNDVVVDVVNGVEVKETKVIGKRYTLRLSNLEKLQRIENNYYLDYSGSITITIPAGKVTDTSGNGNDMTVITSGIDIPGGEVTDISQIDVVQPLWERTAFTTDIHAKTATITLLGTDKYFYEYDLEPGDEGYDASLADKGTLKLEEIGLWINGVATTGTISGGVKTLTDGDGNLIGKLSIASETKLYETRLIQTEYSDGDVDAGYTTETVQYGVQYELSITDLSITANQIKIHLPEGSLVDQSANPNRTTEFLVYNTLRKAQDSAGNWENVETSGFLSNGTIQRQNIEKIEFVANLNGAPTIGTETAEGVILCWDVSAQRDNSILAWATQTANQATRGVYTVTIGSNDKIFGNIDSSYLFALIACGTNCTETDAITGLSLLDTRNVTNMSYMFWAFGKNAMTSLELGNFDTSNVTNMYYMFLRVGEFSMTTLDLGSKFDTGKVTNMEFMFQHCGKNEMTTFNLGGKFDTKSVTNMGYMFSYLGYTKLSSLNLGTKFDTRNVTNMRYMFWNCGYTAMTSLDLSSGTNATNTTQFNTKNVTDMSCMFQYCGYTAMTTFNLGNNFDTSNVTNMHQMFYNCGVEQMTSLDLGNKFDTSNVIAMDNMFSRCGRDEMTSLILGDKFDTSKVTNMRQMFNQCGKEKLTSLYLGEKFYTTNVTNMYGMFANTSALTTLDLGPAFTKIPNGKVTVDSNEYDAYYGMFLGVGTTSTTIYASEQMYNTMSQFKLNANSNTTISLDVVDDTTTPVTYRGKIVPIYKPEWEKVSSTIDVANKKIEITIKGNANKTFTNGSYTGTYASEITSLITAGNDATNKLLVKIDGEIDGDTDRDGVLETGETPTITKAVEVVSQSATEVKYKITLSGFEQALRQSGADKNFLEWSGNIAVQPIKGTLVDKYGSYIGTETQTDGDGNIVTVQVPVTGVFTDASGNYIGNKNMISIDDADGNWYDIEIRDALQDGPTGNWTDLEDNNTEASTNGTMFTDFIKPEFTYAYSVSNPNIQGDPNNRVTIIFDVTDKYFKNTSVSVGEDLDNDGVLDEGEDVNGNGILDTDNITVTVDSDEDANTSITKTLSKVEDLYYTVNGVTTHKVGERYQLVIDGLESTNGIGYSGPLTLTFPQNVITDLSGNKSDLTAITMGVNEPGGDADDEIIVDVVNPVWSYADSDIDRTNKEVNIYIIGSDKYYYTDAFKAYITDMADGTLNDTTLLDDITVYVDNSATTVDTNRDGTADANVTGITKTLTDITDEMKAAGNEARLAELIAGAGLTDKMTADNNLTKVGVIYKLTLSTFGTISGETKVVINPGTIEDVSGNINTTTTIEVGNVTWVEDNEPLENGDPGYPRYTAFRNDVVDFIKPIITYEYSTVMIDTDGDGTADTSVSANPDIDYEQKEVTVKFKVTDKYLLGSDLIKTTTDGNGNTIQVPKNISISVDGTKVYDGNLETQPYEVRATIAERAIDNGKEYTLVISNLQQTNTSQPTDTTPENGNGFNFSGPMTIDFVGNVIDDTSGNKNDATSITLDTHVNPDVVDVVDPIIYKTTSSIDRGAKSVTINLIAKDKYLKQQVLTANQNSVKVRVEDEYGNTIVEDTTTIRKNISQTYFNTSNGQANFSVVLDNFGVYEGKTTIIIPANMIIDTSGNGNIETEIVVGNTNDTPAFENHIVDFTKPTWEYVVSSIERDFDASDRRLENGELGTNNPDGTVTIEVKGTDIYFDKPAYFENDANKLNLNNVVVYVNGVAKDDIQVDYATNPDGSIVKEYIEETKELATGYSRVFKGVKYKLILSNFGEYDGQVKIDIPVDAIKDTSENGNIVTPIDVGNPAWVETDEPLTEGQPGYPKYPAFRNDYVDFIKPVITYKYEENVNPKLIRTTDAGGNPVEKVEIQFTVTDTNFLESNIGTEDIKVFIDDDYEMQVYGTGANAATAITAEISQEVLPIEDGNGIIYTLTLSGLELNQYINSEIFERHSGRVKLIIAADQVYDTSGNPNNETTIIVDNDNGDDPSNIEVVDFVSPNIYYKDKYINWNERYAVVTLRATDRYFDDEDSNLQPSDITLYENGTQITDFAGKIQINKTRLTDAFGNMLGYDYIIRLNEFTEEFKLEVRIPGMKLYDTSDNYNDPTNIFVDLDNRKPTWEYVSTDTSGFEPDNGGTISFNVKGVDKFLNLTDSNLEVADLQVLLDDEVYLDGSDATDAAKITVTHTGTDENEKSKSYKIDVTGLTEVGTYTLVFADGTLIDTFNNESAATTITFSKAVIAPNTANYTNITYHITPDHETVHSSYVHELMSVDTSGTNSNPENLSATYRPSTLGELYNNGENPLFKEPLKKPIVGADGYTMSKTYSPVSFAGWAESDSDGNIIYYTNSSLTTVSTTKTAYTRTFGLYDEIPRTITNLKAVWQDATIVFVSASTGDDANNGSVSATDEIQPVKTLERAYELLSGTGTSTNNIIVIMDAVEWNSTATLTGNATITSLYAGVDYRATGAELKISSNMIVDGDIIFDNIELYADSITVSNGTNYLGNGTYTNMLISNYSGDITLGRGVTTPTGKYTFGAIIGGNYKTETSAQATHAIRVEAGKYNNIIAGSTLTSSTLTKSATHHVVIGNMRDAAISRNTKLTITGYLAMGENEFKCYPTGVTSSASAANQDYSVVTVYSGTFTGANKFTKATENSSIYLRSINGATDGEMEFEMFGGNITGNIYGGASSTSYTGEIFNTMKFYGGQVTGDIFGQSANDTFKGGSDMTFQGIFAMNGNIFGGSNVTTTVTDSTVLGTGASTITIDNISILTGGSVNVYGGSKSTAGYMEGNATITLNTGKVTNIYGGGYGSGVQGTTNITINNGLVTGNVFGGGKNGEARAVSNITVLGGTIGGNIYGGNDNSDITEDTVSQDINIIIGDTDATKAPTITGNIYGSGQNDNVDAITIQLIEAADTTTVYGGSDENAVTTSVDIYLKGMTVDNIYGGGQSAGTVGTANIYLQAGAAEDVYGGGYATDVTTSNITLQGITIDTEEVTATVEGIYGGSYNGGTVETSNVTLKSGNVTDVFGGGNSATSVGTANVTLDGITINTIHGGSKDAGAATKTNVTLLSGTVETVFGGGLDVGTGEANISHQGSAVVTNIYGGNDSGSGTGGETTTTNIKISSNVTNVYGGNYLKGTTTNANIIIHGTPTISGKLFAGGYKSNIGTAAANGSTTIKVVGGTINNDINGGSEEGIVYGTTNMYIGVDSFIDPTLTAGNVEIKGTIYGAGSATTSGYTTQSVVGNTHITMDNSSVYPITFSGSIFGSGKNSTYSTSGTASDASTINIKDFGTSVENTHQLISIERTGKLNIGKSFIELTGRQDEYNFYKKKSYTINRITSGLTIYDNTTLFNRRGFNMVGGFNSYQTLGGSKATMMNVQNRLYTFEGINLIFAKQEGDIYANPIQDIWGDVNGMTFFGMYAIDRDDPTKKVLDIYAPDFDGDAEEDFFANGTYVEGRHKTPSHSLTSDGFYTNIADYSDPSNITVSQQVINATDYGKYYDWIVGAEIVNYETTLVGSTYGKESIAEVLLDYQYENGATYTLDRVSLNPLNIGVNLVETDSIPTMSANANNTFALTMETDRTGWLSSSLTNIYTESEGSFDGDTSYASDSSAGAGKIIFKLHNSINITEKKDLGNIDLILTGRTPELPDGTGANTFIVVIAVNIQTLVDNIGNKYEPSFTDSVATELSYTTDSKVDLSYLLYNTVDATPYATGDYRVISSTVRFPEGTKITMKDYGQGDSLNKVYYYHVPNTTPATETKDGVTRYLYRLSDFNEMGSTNSKYADNNTTYYHSADGYAYEKYDISIDFIDSNIAQSLANETYLELKNSSNDTKYDNEETRIKYDLYLYSSTSPIYSAQFAETISNQGQSYSVVESLEIPFTITASLLEQAGIMDTKYYDQTVGIAVQIVGESGIRIKSPELQNFKLKNLDTGVVYDADENGVIRMPIIEGFGTLSANYSLSLEQSNVAPGVYTAQVRLFAADDGKYYGTEPAVEKTFSITFISKLAGLVGAEATDDSRIINATTGLNLETGNTANKAVDITVGVANPSNETNIRVELYKRNPTYTDITDEESYTGTAYTLVDIAQYLKDTVASEDTDATDDSEDALDTWVTPSTYGLTAANQYEYMVMNKKAYSTPHDIITIEFEKAIMSGIDTGEYKLVFKAYSDDTLVQTVKKTFIVVP